MRRLLPHALSALLAMSTAHAQGTPGPFGLHMGMTLEQLKGSGVQLEKTFSNPANFEYTARQLPIKNKVFRSYTLLVSPSYGLCRVMAQVAYDDSALGSVEFSIVWKQLTSLYGAHNDFLDSGLGSRAAMWSSPVIGKVLTPYKRISLDYLAGTKRTLTIVYEGALIEKCNKEQVDREADDALNSGL